MDFAKKFGPELIMNIWELIKEHVKELKVEGIFLRFASGCYIVILVILIYSGIDSWLLGLLEEKVLSFCTWLTEEWRTALGSVLMDFLYYTAAAFLARISSVAVAKLVIKVKWPDALWKETAYEEIEGHLYLKQEYLPLRSFEIWIQNKIVFIWTFILLFYFLFFYNRGFFGAVERMDSVITHLLIWLKLKGEYYNGKTYQEMQQFFNPPKRIKRRVVDTLTNKIMRESIKQFQVFSFPAQYGIHYPRKAFADNYRAFYEALQSDKSIYVEDIFYHDWERAFFIPANKILLEYRKIVVLAGISLDVQDIECWLKNGFERLNGCDEAWKIRIWDESNENSEILIVPFEKIPQYVCKSRIIHENDRGLFCVVLEPSSMMVELQFYLEQYVEFLTEMKEKPFFCFADRYMIGLRDYLSHVFQCRIEQIEINTDRSQQIYLCTSETGENEEVRDYWGILLGGSGCGSVYFHELLKGGFENIEYVSDSIIPVKDFCCLMKDKMAVTFSSEAEKLQLEKTFNQARFLKGIWEIPREEEKCIIVTDENCHLYDLIWALSTRGIRNCYLFLLSGDYLLFDYMMNNINRLLKVRNAVPVMFPVYQDSDRNCFLRIFRRWKLYGDFDIGKLKEIYSNDIVRGKEELCFLLNRRAKKLFHGKPFRFLDGHIVMRSNFFVHQSELWKEVVYVDEQTEQRSFGCLFACHLMQRWRKEQFLVKDGRYYQIREIRDRIWEEEHGKARDCKEVRLLRSSGFMQHTGLYYQDKRYILRILEQRLVGDREDRFVMIRCTANITVITGDWYLEHFDDRGDWREKSVHDQVPVRRYWNKSVLLICLPCQNITFWQQMREILIRITRTLYPTHYPYIDFVAEDNTVEGMAGIYVVEDCVDDLGILESFEKNWDRIISLCCDLGKEAYNNGAEGVATAV